MSFAAILRSVAGYLGLYMWDGDTEGNVKIVRIIAGVLAVVILVIIIQRRRTRM